MPSVVLAGGTGCADVAVTCVACAHTDSPPSDVAQVGLSRTPQTSHKGMQSWRMQ